MAVVGHDHVYREETGAWYRKGEQPQEEEERQGLLDKLKDKLQDL
jgi:hypothetical protein